MGFPKIGGTILGVPITRTLFIGVCIGAPLFGTKLAEIDTIFEVQILNCKRYRAPASAGGCAESSAHSYVGGPGRGAGVRKP